MSTGLGLREAKDLVEEALNHATSPKIALIRMLREQTSPEKMRATNAHITQLKEDQLKVVETQLEVVTAEKALAVEMLNKTLGILERHLQDKAAE